MSDTHTELSQIIRAARESNPNYKSLRAFAAALGRSPSYVSKVERGDEKPGADLLARIAELLDLPAPRLFQAARMLEPDVQEALEANYERLEPSLRQLLVEAK